MTPPYFSVIVFANKTAGLRIKWCRPPVPASRTSSKAAEVKLTNVARASLEELLEDYRDFLRIRKLPLWDKDHEKALAIRKLGYGTDVSYMTYTSYVESETPEVAANSIICLIHQTNYLLDQQIRRLEKDFMENGGLRERMTRARLRERGKQGNG